MTETATGMGRVPVGDPIPLRFDPQTKKQLDEVAAGIGPRRFGALIRVAAHRLLADPDRVPTALDEYRRASAAARSLPRVEIVFDLDPATDRRLAELARAHHTKRSAIVRVAAHRFLTTAGRFRPHLLREDARGDLTCRTRLHVNRSTLDRLDRLTGRNGDVLTAAALRVALRRLLDHPGDLTTDLTTIGAVRDLAPEVFGPRTNVHFDDELRDQLDALVRQLGSDRAELMRLAAHQLLAHQRDLEQAVTDEIYRGDANRGQLLARNERRKTTTTVGIVPAGAVKAPSPAGRPFGKPHSFLVDEDTKRELHELADEYGPRRVSALVRVGIRRLIADPDAGAALAQARRVSAQARTVPHERVTLRLEPPAAARFEALAGAYAATPSDLVAVALHRFLAAPGDYRDVLLAESTSVQLDEKFTVSIRPSIRREVEQLANQYGNRMTSTLVRVAVRRLLDKSGNLTVELTTVVPVHDLRPEPPKARIAVALDDELLVHLDALAGRLGSTRQELVYLAATRILRQHTGIETLMLDEMYRAPGNRQKLITRHARRERRRRTGRGDGA
ncbi:CopG family transcriptional regulator (plasmid) [Rhodococcus sp. ZPP]|uniref:ribbon-helix-helix domain-containing protein n=1 Tax=Rhodococcus sp. ZPP TaxID=2749906 RepID=UPI001AD86DDD|nr:CopG family transcriptional regulator [Rhodococcus sp. ZPP]QTJ70443.1 CopG family transcriptional regulator [Rhodococcus sp. ZPP]